ncbi:MAG: hypothetical protein AB8B52_01500 [Winogradskyella sp.]|uniref:hypothetical protein n=1 Tax=Winogradskyella sp. TaxID=1883156 RepID=UPI00385E6B2F
MKKLLLIFTFLVIPLCVFSQKSTHRNPVPLAKYNTNVNAPLTAKERAQIIEVYGDAADKMVFNIPSRLKSIKHILRNRVVIKRITDEKNKKPCPKLSEIEFYGEPESSKKVIASFNPDSFNPLQFNFNFYSRAAGLFQVDNTNYYIIIKSQYQ